MAHPGGWNWRRLLICQARMQNLSGWIQPATSQCQECCSIEWCWCRDAVLLLWCAVCNKIFRATLFETYVPKSNKTTSQKSKFFETYIQKNSNICLKTWTYVCEILMCVLNVRLRIWTYIFIKKTQTYVCKLECTFAKSNMRLKFECTFRTYVWEFEHAFKKNRTYFWKLERTFANSNMPLKFECTFEKNQITHASNKLCALNNGVRLITRFYGNWLNFSLLHLLFISEWNMP